MNFKIYSSRVLSEITDVINRINGDEIAMVVSTLSNAYKKNIVITAGAGRMGLSSKAFSMRLKHLGFDSWSLGDTTLPRTGLNDILIIASGSGETPSMIAIANQAAKHKQKIILFTCNKNSTIAKLACNKVIIPATSTLDANNNSIQIMKTLVEQCVLIIMDIVTLLVIESLSLNRDNISKNHSILE